MGCHALFQRIFPTQGSNPHLLRLLNWQAGSFVGPSNSQRHLWKADIEKGEDVEKDWRFREGRNVQFSSVAQSCLTLCNPMDCSTPGLPVHHQPPKPTQIHVHRVGDAIQPSHPRRPLLLPPSIFPSIEVFSVSRFFASGGQSIGVSASVSVLPMNIQD